MAISVAFGRLMNRDANLDFGLSSIILSRPVWGSVPDGSIATLIG